MGEFNCDLAQYRFSRLVNPFWPHADKLAVDTV